MTDKQIEEEIQSKEIKNINWILTNEFKKHNK